MIYCPATMSWQSNIGRKLDLDEWTCGGNALVLCTTNQQFYNGPQVLMLVHTMLWLQCTGELAMVHM